MSIKMLRDSKTLGSKGCDQQGASLVEFAIVLAALVLMLQASLMLCEHVAFMSWLENTTHQLNFLTAQSRQSDVNKDIEDGSSDLLGIFGDKRYWRLFALTASKDSQPSVGAGDSAQKGPKVTATISSGELSIGLSGDTQSIWSGVGGRGSKAIITRLNGSLGYHQLYESSSNSAGVGESVTFSCADGVKTRCTGGTCTGPNGCGF